MVVCQLVNESWPDTATEVLWTVCTLQHCLESAAVCERLGQKGTCSRSIQQRGDVKGSMLLSYSQRKQPSSLVTYISAGASPHIKSAWLPFRNVASITATATSLRPCPKVRWVPGALSCVCPSDAARLHPNALLLLAAVTRPARLRLYCRQVYHVPLKPRSNVQTLFPGAVGVWEDA